MSCPTFWPSTDDSCGRGACVGGSCDCENGWQSVGDLTLVPFESCDISKKWLNVIWKIFLSINVLGLLATSYVVFRRLQAQQFKKLPLTMLNVGLLISPLYYVFGLSLGAYRVAEPRAYLGLSKVSSALFFFMQQTLYVFTVLNVYSLKILMLRQAKMKEIKERLRRRKYSKLLDAAMWTVNVTLFFASVFPLWQCFDPTNESLRTAHFAFSWLGISIATGCGMHIMSGVINDLEEVVESVQGGGTQVDQIKRLAKKFKFQMILLNAAGGSTAGNSLLYAFVPWLVRKGSYTIPLNWMIGSVFVFWLVFNLFGDSSGGGGQAPSRIASSKLSPARSPMSGVKSSEVNSTTWT